MLHRSARARALSLSLSRRRTHALKCASLLLLAWLAAVAMLLLLLLLLERPCCHFGHAGCRNQAIQLLLHEQVEFNAMQEALAVCSGVGGRMR